MAERKVGKQERGEEGRKREEEDEEEQRHALCKCNWLLCISEPPTDSDVVFLSFQSNRKNVGE